MILDQSFAHNARGRLKVGDEGGVLRSWLTRWLWTEILQQLYELNINENGLSFSSCLPKILGSQDPRILGS